MSFVLDSSVALAWVLPDEGNSYADELLERLIADGAVVPPIWPLEIGNVLLVALRRGRIRQEEFEATSVSASATLTEVIQGLIFQICIQTTTIIRSFPTPSFGCAPSKRS